MGKKSRFLEILPNFLLFILFACCMFFVLLSGAKLYKNVTGVMEEQFSVQTCASYVTSKIRHYDKADAVLIGKIGDIDALLLNETINDKEYVTYLYCYKDQLMELFCEEDLELSPAAGQVIMPLNSFSITGNSKYISLFFEAEGKEATAVVSLQSEKGGVE